MNSLRKLWCRTYQTCFRLAIPLLPYREPKPLGSFEEAAGLLQQQGKRRVLLVTDATIMRLGLADQLIDNLKSRGIQVSVFDEGRAQPHGEQCRGLRESAICKKDAMPSSRSVEVPLWIARRLPVRAS